MPQPRTLTPEQEKLVVERYSVGEPALRISKDFNVTAQTIHNTLRRHGVTTRPELTKRRLTDVQKTLVIETCMSGSTVEAAAKLVGTSPTNILRILKAAGVRLPKGRPPSCTASH